ncbi:MAG: antitoxin transcriptional regulator of toxin/antitoxin module [Chitinophagaceae bacterium]|nr:antitoxin transcriptional regulator of toxin/antitoxin module [Chitinophagaceae bacterium]
MSTRLKDDRELLSKPGDTILETLEHLRMTQVELAERMGKKPSKIHDIITGKEPITVNTALQLEKVLGIDSAFWLTREIKYRETLSRIEQEEALEECKDWLKMQPIKELKSHGFIKSERPNAAMVEECLQFYGVASTMQWENIYVLQYASTSFRRSPVHQTALGSMAAWLRIGEIIMQKLSLPLYNKDGFKDVLGKLKKIVRQHPEDYAEQLQQSCISVGVALVYTISLPKAPISGATRWMGGNPLIQLTDRYKTNDQFWFTFYHEAAHVLLHGKKEVFLEDFEGYTQDEKKEKEANDFASRSLLDPCFVNDVPEGKVSENDIIRIARKYETHPAIVVGQLHHLKKVPYSFGSEFSIKVVLDDIIRGDKEIEK